MAAITRLSKSFCSSTTSAALSACRFLCSTPFQPIDWTERVSVCVHDQVCASSSALIQMTTALSYSYEIARGKPIRFSTQDLIDNVEWHKTKLSTPEAVARHKTKLSTPEAVLRYAMIHGIYTEEEYPYVGKVQASNRPNLMANNIMPTNIYGYREVQPGSLSDMLAILQYTPVVLSHTLFAPDVLRNYSQGIISFDGLFKFAPLLKNGDVEHYVTYTLIVMGCGQEKDTGKKFLKLQNSMGTKWGENGFMRVALEDYDETGYLNWSGKVYRNGAFYPLIEKDPWPEAALYKRAFLTPDGVNTYFKPEWQNMDLEFIPKIPNLDSQVATEFEEQWRNGEVDGETEENGFRS